MPQSKVLPKIKFLDKNWTFGIGYSRQMYKIFNFSTCTKKMMNQSLCWWVCLQPQQLAFPKPSTILHGAESLVFSWDSCALLHTGLWHPRDNLTSSVIWIKVAMIAAKWHQHQEHDQKPKNGCNKSAQPFDKLLHYLGSWCFEITQKVSFY